MRTSIRTAAEDLKIAAITLRVREMLDMIDKEGVNERDIEEKYFRVWKDKADPLAILRKELSKELFTFCDLEIRKTQDLCFKTIKYISES